MKHVSFHKFGASYLQGIGCHIYKIKDVTFTRSRMSHLQGQICPNDTGKNVYILGKGHNIYKVKGVSFTR